MTKLKKTISWGMLLPVLVLNFSPGLANSCSSVDAKSQMNCCASMKMQPGELNLEFTTSSCVCHLTGNDNSAIPIVNTTINTNLNSNDLVQNIISMTPSLGRSLTSLESIFIHSKFSLNLKNPPKIYILNAAYLN